MIAYFTSSAIKFFKNPINGEKEIDFTFGKLLPVILFVLKLFYVMYLIKMIKLWKNVDF